MKERPILFNSEMVRAVLDGRKTQTRRAMKIPHDFEPWKSECEPDYGYWLFTSVPCSETIVTKHSPFGIAGDRLWVKETFHVNKDGSYQYRATCGHALSPSKWSKWTPSIHMPRQASRITLEVVDVRVERVQHISITDAIAEGMPCPAKNRYLALENFEALWDSIYLKDDYGWDANPWVWVCEFKKRDN